jgi:hypothetical protein
MSHDEWLLSGPGGPMDDAGQIQSEHEDWIAYMDQLHDELIAHGLMPTDWELELLRDVEWENRTPEQWDALGLRLGAAWNEALQAHGVKP